MAKATGIYETKLKNGTASFRVSITYKGKHISLGSYPDISTAENIYSFGKNLIESDLTLENYSKDWSFPHDKYVTLINFRDNGIYFPTPIYLRKQYFEYYLTSSTVLKFDRDDLFFYASHKIQKRGGYLFVSDYGSQYKILSRYGIKPFAVYGRDYIMINGDTHDFRYSNIKILNNYMGVLRTTKNGRDRYVAQIHINGNYIVGTYKTETEAAIAYNKAADTVINLGLSKQFIKNYIVSISKEEYKNIYDSLQISEKITGLTIN